MTVKTTPITLSELLHDIDEPNLINSQLELYSNSLIDNHQFEIKYLLPVLQERLQDITDGIAALADNSSTSSSIVENLANKSITLQSTTLNPIQSLMSDHDLGDSLNHSMTQITSEYTTIYSGINDLVTEFIDQMFKENELNVNQLVFVLDQLDRMHTSAYFNESWAVKWITLTKNSVDGYANIINKGKFLPLLANLYQQAQELAKDIKGFSEEIVKIKSSNPLISDEVVELSQQLYSSNENLCDLLNTTINQLYQHEESIKLLESKLVIYSLLADKLDKTS